MKKLAILVVAIVVGAVVSSCSEKASAKVNADNVKQAAQRDIKSAEVAEIKFDKVLHDFGKIKEGDIVETTFKFTNVGKGDLIISNASSSCGCTVPNLKDIKGKAFKTGESGEFSVKFNSRGKPNLTTKVVTINANTAKGKETVKIKVFAEPDPEAAKKRAAAKAKRAAQMKNKKIAPAKVEKPIMLQNVK